MRATRDLAAREHWERSLERSVRRRELAPRARRELARRKHASAAMATAMLAGPVAPFAALAAVGGSGGSDDDAPAGRTIEVREGSLPLTAGSTGAMVEELQRALGVPVDGVFGSQTAAAVRSFQAAAGLQVDGIVGPDTWGALFSPARAASGAAGAVASSAAALGTSPSSSSASAPAPVATDATQARAVHATGTPAGTATTQPAAVEGAGAPVATASAARTVAAAPAAEPASAASTTTAAVGGDVPETVTTEIADRLGVSTPSDASEAVDVKAPAATSEERSAPARAKSPAPADDPLAKPERPKPQRDTTRAKPRRVAVGDVPVSGCGSTVSWPVRGTPSSEFGPRWGRMHEGLDIPAPSGSAVRAAACGVVSFVGQQSGYGNIVCITHTNSFSTCYAHLSGFATRTGARIRAGELLGYVGCTGSCTGPHVHFETRTNGSAQNPRPYLAGSAMPGTPKVHMAVSRTTAATYRSTTPAPASPRPVAKAASVAKAARGDRAGRSQPARHG